MKQLKKIILILICIAFGLLLMYLLGFRITYAPRLENNWDSISAVGTWVSAIISIIAIIFAIQVPEKIAAHQNKIALFERRLSAYYTLVNVLDVFILTSDETIADFYPYLATWICRKHDPTLLKNSSHATSIQYDLEDTINTCEAVSFLFPIDFTENYTKFIKELKDFALYFYPEKPCGKLEERQIEKLTKYAIEIFENEVEQMKICLDLTSISS